MRGELSEPRKLAIAIRTYLPSEILGVALGERGPFFRQVIEGEDRRHRANRDASAAVDALHRIDVQHLLCSVFFTVLFGMDAIHRTSVHTGGVLGSNTRFCNYISHRVICLPEECGTTERNIVARKTARGTKKAMERSALVSASDKCRRWSSYRSSGAFCRFLLSAGRPL